MASLFELLKRAPPTMEGDVSDSLSTTARDPLVQAFVRLQAGRVKDAITAPRDALSGDLQVFDPMTGHVSAEAMDRANGMAGLAMTGSLPMRAPRGALRSFGGAAKKDDPLAALEAGLDDFLAKYPNPKTEAQITAELAAKGPSFGGEPMLPRETMRLDPNAKSWDLYHGSEPGPDFARFDPQMAGIPSERGAVFFAPNPESANGYARATQGGAEAGSRVYRTSVEPGRTAVFDLPHLAETDPAFNARARQLMTDDNGAWAGAHHDSYMDMFRNSRAEDARVAQQMAEMGLPPDPNAGTTLSYGHGHIGAAIERAKAQGLDTAILRGLAEHGGDDQVVALTPNRVRSYYAPDQVLYSGGPGGVAGAATISTAGGPVPNFFDQFDTPAPAGQGNGSQPSGNFFDRFDEPAPASAVGTGEAFLRGAEQGATLGFGDELRGTLAASPMREDMQVQDGGGVGGALKRFAAWNVRNSPLALGAQAIEGASRYFGGDTGAVERYEQAAGENRQRLAEAREQHPIATGAGEITGGVAATLPMAAAAPAAFGAGGGPMLTRMGVGFVSGGALGGVQGAGQAEGNFANRAAGFGYGAAGGGAAGALGAPIAAGVGALARQGMALLPQRAAGLGPAATREATTALAEAGPQQVQQRLAELGPDAMLLDTAQPFLGRGMGLAVEPGAPGQRVVSSLRTRDAGTDARLAQGLEEALGPAPVPSQVEAQFAARRAATGPMYREALDGAPPVDTAVALAVIGQRLNTASGAERAALVRARDLLVEEGPNGLMARSDARYLHGAKQSLDDLIQYGDPTIGVPRGALSRSDSALAAVRGRLNEALEGQVPGYADANLSYRTAARASEALESGRRVLASENPIHPVDFAADLARRPIEQQAALRAGVRADLDRTVGNAANDLTALSGALKRPADWNRQKLAQTFGPEAVEATARTVETNRAMRQSYHDVVQGSQTAQRTRGAAAMGVRDLAPKGGETSGVATALGVVAGPTAAAVPIVMKSGRFGLNALGRASDRVRNEQLADLFTRQGPARDEAVSRLVEALAGREGRQAVTGRGTAALAQALVSSTSRESDVSAYRRNLIAGLLAAAGSR